MTHMRTSHRKDYLEWTNHGYKATIKNSNMSTKVGTKTQISFLRGRMDQL